MTSRLPALLQSFFTDRLLQHQNSSQHTIAGYRDSFRLLLQFAKRRLKKSPSNLLLEDIDVAFVGEFLQHLETVRKNSARTRNARLAAIHSFFNYVALQEPSCALQCHRILAMPSKRYERKPIAFLCKEEIDALLGVPDLSTWIGRRDRTLLLVAVQTGLRVSELIGLNCGNVILGAAAHVRCLGKGRKERCTPLRPETARMMDAWLRERHGSEEDAAFPNIRGGRLSRDAVERLLAKYAAIAKRRCPSIGKKHITPHVLRHSAAMNLLHHGVDRSVIALWLGHESIQTTEIYLHADMDLKERAMSLTSPLGAKPKRYRPDDKLLAFLNSL